MSVISAPLLLAVHYVRTRETNKFEQTRTANCSDKIEHTICRRYVGISVASRWLSITRSFGTANICGSVIFVMISGTRHPLHTGVHVFIVLHLKCSLLFESEYNVRKLKIC